MKKILLCVALMAPLMLSSCAQHHHGPGYSRGGPPPHAPAHGYRHKHHQHDLVFDSGLGVYVVVGLADYYFWDNRYFRYHKGYWQYSEDLNGRWYRDDRRVPRKLYQSRGGPDKDAQGKGKEQGNQGRGNAGRY